jgi:Uma2 family endonuclease
MSAVVNLSLYMSVSDFLAWESGDGLRYELVDGEPRATAPASTIHAFLQNELGSLIRNHLREHRSGCVVLANPGVIPRLLSAHNMRVPDLGVTCSPLIPGQAAMPDPVLLIEVLSPSNQAETWSNVWAYTSIPSVKEILVLHSNRIAADLLRRSPAGDWPQEPVQITKGDLELTSIGYRVEMTDLYALTGLAA